jgi:hypothetical protein
MLFLAILTNAFSAAAASVCRRKLRIDDPTGDGRR